MLHINEVIVVEGLHDKIKLEQVVDAVILTTDGFSIYGNKEKLALFKKLALEKGLIILTDSDRAGSRIRSYLKSCIGSIPVKHAYIPQLLGKERRKAKMGAEGILGVEGMPPDVLEMALKRAGCMLLPADEKQKITKYDLFEDGLSGQNSSRELRTKLTKKLGLPSNLSANALLEVLNSLYSLEEYKKIVQSIK